MSLEVAIEFIGDVLTMTMGFEQGRRRRYDLSMRGDPLMSERDDKWGNWVFDFESTRRRDWYQRTAESIGSSGTCSESPNSLKHVVNSTQTLPGALRIFSYEMICSPRQGHRVGVGWWADDAWRSHFFLWWSKKDEVSCVVECIDKSFGGEGIRMRADEGFWEETRIRNW